MKLTDALVLGALGVGAYLFFKSKNVLTNTGEQIGGGLFDLLNPGAAGESLFYTVTFPSGDKHAVPSNSVSSDGTFHLIVPGYGTSDWNLNVDSQGNKTATVQ